MTKWRSFRKSILVPHFPLSDHERVGNNQRFVSSTVNMEVFLSLLQLIVDVQPILIYVRKRKKSDWQFAQFYSKQLFDVDTAIYRNSALKKKFAHSFLMFPLGINLWEQPLWYVNCLEHAKLDIIDTVKRNVSQGSLEKWTEYIFEMTS